MTRQRARALMAAALTVGALVSLAAQQFTAARAAEVAVPPLSTLTVNAGEVVLRVGVGVDGGVGDVTAVRGDEPFLTATAGAVRQWRFLPAREGRRAVDSHVLVASVFRAPAMYDLPSDRAAARPSPFPDIPFPLATSTPPYSPLAHGGGIVIVEVLVGENGRVTDAQVVATAPPFDDAAVSAARQWQFQPATLRGSAVPAFAYLVFGFSQPLSSPTARPTGRP